MNRSKTKNRRGQNKKPAPAPANMNSLINCNKTGCGKVGSKRCSQCQTVFYCSENCQRENWKEHGPTCKAIKKEMEEKNRKEEELIRKQVEDKNRKDEELREAKIRIINSKLPTPRVWAEGLNEEQQREWMVDTYRMREKEYIECDEEFPSSLGGIYKSLWCERDYDPIEDLVENFLVFCRLAQERGEFPEGWDWKEFLVTAAKLLPFTLDKDGAKEKYGNDEGVVQAPGRRSLRYTAEAIYGSGIMNVGVSELHMKMNQEILKKRRTATMVADVGGLAIWGCLERKLGSTICTLTSENWSKKSKFLSAQFKQF